MHFGYAANGGLRGIARNGRGRGALEIAAPSPVALEGDMRGCQPGGGHDCHQ
jgi:hypothetical protein